MQEYTANKYFRRIIERTHHPAILSKAPTLHTLRHSIATHLLQQGIPVQQVRIFLGHSLLETTQIYTHISGKQLKELTQ